MTIPPGPLAHERKALRDLLDRLIDEEHNLETLCKHAPRLISVAANIARIDTALANGSGTDEIDALRKTLRELENTQPDEEDTPW